MVRIEITEEEYTLLTAILEHYLEDLRYEIGDTDSAKFKEGLRHEQAQITDLIERIRSAPPKPETAPPETAEVKVEKFYRSLPQSGTTPDWLQKVFESAAANGVTLEQGEYILLSNPNAKIEQYRIIFPLKGSYPQLRRFTVGALEAVPALALESLLFKREKIADGSVDAKITFILYLERAR